MEKSLNDKYTNLDKSSKEKIRKSLKSFNILNNYKNYIFVVKESFIIIEVS
jgi:hypothetical protein